MPSSHSVGASFFSGDVGDLLEDFLKEYEELADYHQLTNQQQLENSNQIHSCSDARSMEVTGSF
jgi:hypothetical protein